MNRPILAISLLSCCSKIQPLLSFPPSLLLHHLPPCWEAPRLVSFLQLFQCLPPTRADNLVVFQLDCMGCHPSPCPRLWALKLSTSWVSFPRSCHHPSHSRTTHLPQVGSSGSNSWCTHLASGYQTSVPPCNPCCCSSLLWRLGRSPHHVAYCMQGCGSLFLPVSRDYASTDIRFSETPKVRFQLAAESMTRAPRSTDSLLDENFWILF